MSQEAINKGPVSPSTPNKPRLVYDGDCTFCRIWIDYWKHLTGETVTYESYQEAASRYSRIPRDEFTRAVHLITEDGEVLKGAHAVVRSLAYTPGKRWPLWLFENIPGLPPITEWCYRFIARRRDAGFKITRFLWGNQIVPEGGDSDLLTRWVFLRMLGLIYLIAFASLAAQIVPLVGKEGILPIDQYLQLVRENVGGERYWEFPTLVWLNSSDGFLLFLCWSGVAFSLMLVFGVAPRIASIFLWVFYLSLFHAGQTFLSFQWDILLLETGFLAIFLAPPQILPGISREVPPSKILLWLFRLLLLRLMFFSGYVKLASQDPLWLKLTALTVHYETQPLPTPLSWYVHQLPLWMHQISCAVMFVIELGIPFLMFFPRRARYVSSFTIIILMILIMMSGNYTFFNLLAIALCALLLDDAALRKLMPARLSIHLRKRYVQPRLARWGFAAIATVIILLNLIRWMELFQERGKLPLPVTAFSRVVSPLVIVNSYGLFRVMTNPRYEIIIEGSDDAVTWREYEFKYKPGDVRRAPPWVEPHQPRLDWQMWFAALGDYRQNSWFVNLCVRILQGNQAVVELLNANPFPQAPPRYVRAQLYEYHFSTAGERNASGACWKREFRRLYLPPISLKETE